MALTIIDHDDDKYALIKVVTDQEGFVWEGNMPGIVETEYKIDVHQAVLQPPTVSLQTTPSVAAKAVLRPSASL